jgi:hypothetical protein
MYANSMTVGPLLYLICVATGLQAQTNGPVYNPATDFSPTSNPNGVWSYGYAQALSGPMIPYSDNLSRSGLDIWGNDIALGVPLCLHNPTANTIHLDPFVTPTIGGDVVALHPGPNNEYSIVRFTTPADGVYHVTGAFFGQDTNGASTDVHILKSGDPVFEGAVNGFGGGSGPSFYTTLALHTGDHLDFAVGFGGNNFYYDMTGLAVWISEVCWPIVFVQHPQSATGPPGGEVTLSVEVDGTRPFDYQWYYLGTTPVGGNSPTLTISNLGFDKLGSYYVTVLNCWGLRVWSFPAFVSMTVTNLPPNIAHEPVGATVLQGQTARFNVGVYGQPPLGFWWTHNGIVIPGARQASLVLSNVPMTAVGTYQFFATNAYGFTNSRVATLTVLPNALPTVAVSGPPSNSTVVVPADVPVQVSASGGGSAALLGAELFVDDELVAAQTQPPYQFTYRATNAGLHTLTAVATDANGVQGLASIPLNFAPPPINLSFEPTGSVTLNLTVPTGVRSLVVDASVDLHQWETVTNVMTSGASFSLNDPAAVAARARFYRVKYFLP